MDIALAALCFAMAPVLTFRLSGVLCRASLHYVDGLFGGAIAVLLAVMMAYKAWQAMTTEGLEFALAVGGPLPLGKGKGGF